mmetsp:Transcript_33575/g.80336  ORF Transcript_33575/g.80336 Transcript_33575/m.80336 type:complete len:930 (-) Transcript_33575:470-3259(-)
MVVGGAVKVGVSEVTQQEVVTPGASEPTTGGGMRGLLQPLSSLSFIRTDSTIEGTRSGSTMISSAPTGKRSYRRLALASRITLVVFLLVLATLASLLLYRVLKWNETRFAKEQFVSMGDRASQSVLNLVSRKRLSMASFSAVISEQHPNPEMWPNVHVDGFGRIVDVIAKSGLHEQMGFAPILSYDGLREWEDHAYAYFLSRPDYFPNNTAVNPPFGRGVWRIGPNKTRVHDNDELTRDRGLLLPVFQCCIDNPGDRIRLFNLYSEPKRRKAIDGVINCTRSLRERYLFNESVNRFPDYSCGSQTEFTRIVRFEHRGPAAVMMQPIFPADDPWNIAGIVLSPIVYDEIFEDVFDRDLTGVHAVLESEESKYTYTITDGLVESFQKGDVHDAQFNDLAQSTYLTWTDLEDIAPMPRLKLTMYPTDGYIKAYSTDNPLNAALAALFAVIFATMLFLLYDFFVRSEISERRQLLDAKRRFVRYVSHEVRTPLNAVIMGLACLRSDLDNQRLVNSSEEDNLNGLSESLGLLEDIEMSANSAVEVLNEVLQYDKIERSALKLELSMVEIFDTVEKTVSEFKLPAAKKEIHLKVTYEADNSNNTRHATQAGDEIVVVSSAGDLPRHVRDLYAVADSSRICQIIRNLVSNALKFTSNQGRVLVRISYCNAPIMNSLKHRQQTRSGKRTSKGSDGSKVTVKLNNGDKIDVEPRGHVLMTICDSGAGMTSEQLDSLFGEGVQFNADRLQGGNGSGLGLHITKNLIEQHHGTLDAHSEGLGRGSTFTLSLPLFSAPDYKSFQENFVPCSPNDSFTQRNLRILVVDDVLSNRKLLCRLLERKGHRCDMAENGQRALDAIKSDTEGGYHCILIDFEMPVLNGPDAVRRIREDLGCDVFIVGVTGNMLTEDVEYFISRGANCVLPKPVQLPILEELLVEHGV